MTSEAETTASGPSRGPGGSRSPKTGAVTLRAGLTAAFLAVVLGPVLLGAVFVGAMVTAVDRSRAVDRLGHAAGAVRGTLDALCGELRAGALAAGALADRPAVRERPDVAVQVRDQDDHTHR